MKEDDWPTRLKVLAEQRHLSIRALAEQMGVSQQFLNDVVKGAKPPSPWLKYKYYGLTSWTGSIEQLISLLPEDLGEAIRERDQRGLKKLAEKAEKKAAIKEETATPEKKTTKNKKS